MTWVPVHPANHDPECRRGNDPASAHYGLDRERCDRCKALWARLDEAGRKREAEKPKRAGHV